MRDSEAAAIANPGQAGARAAAAFIQPGVDVSITTTPRKRTVNLDAGPPAREDGPRPIPRRFIGRSFDSGSHKTPAGWAEEYGTCKIHVTRNIIGISGEFWKEGDEVSNVPINEAFFLVSAKSAMFDKSEFKDENELAALEARGYRIEPPALRAKDRPEFQDVIARKHRSKWVSDAFDKPPPPGTA